MNSDFSSIRAVCVFCASSEIVDQKYFDVAEAVGTFCAEKKLQLIYGGAQNGLMGAAADAALAGGGEVIGVMPKVLVDRERAHKNLTALYETEDMHGRQQKMTALGDAFLVLPGGLGTLAEFFEVITWKMIGLHDKPIMILNTDGYWDHLRAVIDRCIGEGFLRKEANDMLIWLDDVEALKTHL